MTPTPEPTITGTLVASDFIAMAKVVAQAPEIVLAALSLGCGREMAFEVVATRINTELARRGWPLIAPLQALRDARGSNQADDVSPEPGASGIARHVVDVSSSREEALSVVLRSGQEPQR